MLFGQIIGLFFTALLTKENLQPAQFSPPNRNEEPSAFPLLSRAKEFKLDGWSRKFLCNFSWRLPCSKTREGKKLYALHSMRLVSVKAEEIFLNFS